MCVMHGAFERVVHPSTTILIRSPSFGCTPGALQRLVDAALTMGFEVVTAAEGARRVA